MKNPNFEAAKEIARWVVFFVVSWLITETLKQVSLVPETAAFKVWVFAYVIPVRMLLTSALTLAGRYVDKYLWVKNNQEDKLKTTLSGPAKGLLPF